MTPHTKRAIPSSHVKIQSPANKFEVQSPARSPSITEATNASQHLELYQESLLHPQESSSVVERIRPETETSTIRLQRKSAFRRAEGENDSTLKVKLQRKDGLKLIKGQIENLDVTLKRENASQPLSDKAETRMIKLEQKDGSREFEDKETRPVTLVGKGPSQGHKEMGAIKLVLKQNECSHKYGDETVPAKITLSSKDKSQQPKKTTPAKITLHRKKKTKIQESSPYPNPSANFVISYRATPDSPEDDKTGDCHFDYSQPSGEDSEEEGYKCFL
ncbi:hypothetical protein QBC44DRAFT_144676 [Cladorrhinum sp. PSN332]|nr:hypothetical protein QBC44DRAFT_144676 [Cladorrhinum sp. PSN332]